jgi:gliding motility-associated-like protein
LCNKDTVELKISGTNNVVWTPNKFINDTTQLKPIVFPLSDQKYYANSITRLGCIFYDSVLIGKRNLFLNIGKDSSICEGDSLLITSNISLSNYQWNTGSNDSFIVVNKSGVYHLFSKDSLNCVASDTVIITLLNQPYFELGKDTNLCFPHTINIGTYTYFKNLLWNTGDTSNIINVKESGTYRLTINKDFKCSYSDSIYINVNLLPNLIPMKDTSICIGDTIEIGTKQRFEKYQWLSGENTSTIKVNKTGNYVITVIDSVLCEGKDTINVNEIPFPNVTITGDTIPCRNNYQINSIVNTSVSYEWNTGHKTPYINLINGLSIKEPVVYLLKVINQCGNDIDNIKIQPCSDPIFHIPTAFSPNSNNLNEVFKIEGENLKWIKIEIYNRWGEKLFEQIGESPSWDGKYKQELCMEGIYLYMVSIKAQNGKYFYLKGTLTLLR